MKVCDRMTFDRKDGGVDVLWEPVPEEEAKKWILEQAAKLAEADQKPKTNAARRNSVRLDPVRLRMAFPGGVPDVRLPEIFADPEKHAEIWQVLEYVFGGTKEYKTEAERNIDALVGRMSR